MSVRVVVAYAALGLTAARADVRRHDVFIDVGVGYDVAPVQFSDQREQMVGTTIRLGDRNGVFSSILEGIIHPPKGGECSDQKGGFCRNESYWVEGTTLYRRVAYDLPSSPSADIDRSTISSNIVIYLPNHVGSNTRGFSVDAHNHFSANAKWSFGTGLRWARLRADLCGTSADPERCQFQLLALSLRATGRVASFAQIDAGWDLNALALFAEEAPRGGAHASPFFASLTLSPIDRIYVKAGVQAAPRTITEPGFFFEAGLRL